MRSTKLLITRLLFLLMFFLSAHQAYADHLKGGWIRYSYLDESDGKINYRVSFYQYSDCDEPEKVDREIYLGIFDLSRQLSFPVKTVKLTALTDEDKNNFGPCFQNPPAICYLVAEYTTTISLPRNALGYALGVQRCCRVNGIANVPASNSVGISYTITIPGGSASVNNSPAFSFNDTVAICYEGPFSFNFSAIDIDGDELVYSLCSGLAGGNQIDPIIEDPSAPPYASIPYILPYSGVEPLGSTVSIDSKTGILSGTAPSKTGTYVVAVCIDEYRNGLYISHTRKEIHLDVTNCKLGGADLNPSYITCDGFNFTFINNADIDAGYSYFWDFGVTTINSDTSLLAKPTYKYGDTGTYTVTLKASNGLGCNDSDYAQVKIYPGFNTDFSLDGSCIQNPYNFKDLTTTRYGFVNSWQWYFGETGTKNDSIPNPVYTFEDTGRKTITFISGNSKGCIDSVTKVVDIIPGPDISVKFSDTLICNLDTLQLRSFSSRPSVIYSWSPPYNIINANSGNPFVYPKQTTKYNLLVNDDGCISQDSVTVNVTDKVFLTLSPDTSICKTDTLQLVPNTNALYFSWSPAAGLSSSSVKQPSAVPLSTTNYALHATIGNCFADDAINIKVVPYPVADAGLDANICYGKSVQLNGSITGAYYTWSPSSSLYQSNTLKPLAGPQATTQYVLRVVDTLGCSKPVYDSVLVKVIPPVDAFAGNDTAIVRRQPLQMQANGGANYLWSPAGGLSNPNISNPVFMAGDGRDTVSYIVKVSTPEGCSGNDSITIYIFETKPEAFIPNAFTPNGDGANDVFRPTVAGMSRFLYFRVYNRWGQLLFSTSEPNKGWDGVYKNKKQPSGTYIYVIEAIEYSDVRYFKKGTFVLIR